MSGCYVTVSSMSFTTSEIDCNIPLVYNSTTDTHDDPSNNDRREIRGCASDSSTSHKDYKASDIDPFHVDAIQDLPGER